MTTRHEKVKRFLALHRPGEPLVLPNPWDAGTAKLFASLGFQALATTSSGHAGCSVEDHTGDAARAFYDAGLAAERVTAAAEVSRSGESRLVLTAQAENYRRGK